MKKLRRILFSLLLVLFLPGVSQIASASCNITIVSAGPCLADGTAGNPKVGDTYALKMVFNISGTPSQHFNLVWKMANVSFTNLVTVGQGNGYSYVFNWILDLDDGIPWSIQVDPEGVSGNTNPTKSANGIFTPTPPATAVELFSPQVWQGFESSFADFQPGSGTISTFFVLYGMPTTHGAQSVFSISPPANSTAIVTPPYNESIYQIARTNVPAGPFRDTNTFIVLLSRTRVNPTILRTVTWADMSSMSSDWTQWLAPDGRCQSTAAVITNFVASSLPANYKTTMTPYDTARSLHLTVAKLLTYEEPPPHIDATNVLADKIADCGGFSALLTAAYRNIGIPARCISGFREGENIPHVRVEFHLPGTEWLVADPTDSNTNDPTGTFAYDFGVTSDSAKYVAVDYGDAHVLPYNTFEFIQVPNLWWLGGGTLNSYTFAYGLVPTPTVIGQANPPAGGSVTGSGTYTGGANVQLTATASNGWTFASWSDGNKQNPRTVTVPATGTNYVANFAQPSVQINVSGNLSFGNVTIGTTNTATLTISNPGAISLTVSSISYSNAAFSGAYSGVISPGGSQPVTVSFAPTTASTYSGAVKVNSDAASGTDTIIASGKGVAPVVDTTKPTLIVTAPKAKQSVTNGNFTVTGTAKDNVGVTAVYYQLNTGAWTLAETANGWTNWDVPNLALAIGTNVLRVYAVDGAGNPSLTNSVTFEYAVLSPVTIQIVGLGTVTPNLNGMSAVLGRSYSFTAKATTGFAFHTWGGSVVTNAPKVTVVMVPGLTLQANFVDVKKPVNIILVPKANQKWSNAVFTATGKASDNWGVSNVWYQLNGSGWAAAMLDASHSNWTTSASMLLSGSNFIQAFAQDGAGNASLTNAVKFTYLVQSVADWAPDSMNGLLAQVSPDGGVFENVGFDITSFAQTGSGTNADDYGTGTYTYSKTDTNTASLQLDFASPPAAASNGASLTLIFTNHSRGFFTNADSGDTGGINLVIATNTVPGSVAGKTLAGVDGGTGQALTLKFLNGVGFTKTPANDGGNGTNSGTYTFTRVNPVCGLAVLTFTNATDVGSVTYLQTTFTNTTSGTYFTTFYTNLATLPQISPGRFMLH